MIWNFSAYFCHDFQEVVKSKDVIKDFGIMIHSNLSYDDQHSSCIDKTKQKAARVLMNFSTMPERWTANI